MVKSAKAASPWRPVRMSDRLLTRLRSTAMGTEMLAKELSREKVRPGSMAME